MTQEQQDKQAKLDRGAFFNLYYGQDVLRVSRTHILETVGFKGWNLNHPDFHLELRSLDMITDEDALEVARILDINHSGAVEDVKEWLNDRHGFSRIKHKWECLEIFDYLRSLEYLIPFRQYSTQQLLDLGWAKIKEG